MHCDHEPPAEYQLMLVQKLYLKVLTEIHHQLKWRLLGLGLRVCLVLSSLTPFYSPNVQLCSVTQSKHRNNHNPNTVGRVYPQTI